MLVVGLALNGIGGGLAIPAVTSAVMGSAPTALAGIASATLNAGRQVGGVLGVAVLGGLAAGGGRVEAGAMHEAVVIAALGLAVASALCLRARAAARPRSAAQAGRSRCAARASPAATSAGRADVLIDCRSFQAVTVRPVDGSKRSTASSAAVPCSTDSAGANAGAPGARSAAARPRGPAPASTPATPVSHATASSELGPASMSWRTASTAGSDSVSPRRNRNRSRSAARTTKRPLA